MCRRYAARRKARPPSIPIPWQASPIDRGTGPRHRWLAAIPHPRPAPAFGLGGAPCVEIGFRHTAHCHALAFLEIGFIGAWRANHGCFLLKYSDNIVFVRLDPCD